MSRSPAARILAIDRPFELELGGVLPRLEIAYETWGKLSSAANNAVLVIPAFSAGSHARSGNEDPTAGWWDHMVGPDGPIDTRRHHVICPSLLGGCHGTTGPLTKRDDLPQGRLWRGDFPLVTIGDIVRVHLLLLDELGIDQVRCVVGGSMGAMQALELAISSPGRTQAAVAISGTDRTRPATAAIRYLGRRAIMNDPEFRSGHYEGIGPRDGLGLAREIGTVFYRSKAEFNDRFDWRPIATPSLTGITFDVQSYLRHQGRKAVGRFDANAYLRLSLAMDLHDLARRNAGLGQAVAGNPVRFLICGVREDRLMPLDEQLHLHEELVASGCESRWAEFSSPVGHDAFLVPHEAMQDELRRFMKAL